MATTYDPKVRELVDYFYPGAREEIAHQVACDLQERLEDVSREHNGCDYCGALEGQHATSCSLHPDYDPTPWCSGCGARRKADCDCGPIADNN